MPATLRQAIVMGSVMASFDVEAFSLDRLRSLRKDEIERPVPGVSSSLTEFS